MGQKDRINWIIEILKSLDSFLLTSLFGLAAYVFLNRHNLTEADSEILYGTGAILVCVFFFITKSLIRHINKLGRI